MGYTERVVYLHDNQLCVITPAEWHVYEPDESRVERRIHQIEWDRVEARQGNFEHFMLKEIHEQPEALENAMRGRLDRRRCQCPFRRAESHDGAVAGRRPPDSHGLRDELSRRTGGGICIRRICPNARRGRVRMRISLPQPAHRRKYHCPGHYAVGRNGRHIGGCARIQTQGAPDARVVQCRGQHHRPRG